MPAQESRGGVAVAAGASAFSFGGGAEPEFVPGLHLQGQVTLRQSTRVDLRAEGLWARHPARGEDGEARVLGTALSVTYHFRPTAVTGLYLLGGAGVYERRVQFDVRRMGPGGPSVWRETDWAPSIGVGLRFVLAGRPAFVEGREHLLGAADGRRVGMVALVAGLRL